MDRFSAASLQLRRFRTTPTANSPAKRLNTQSLKNPQDGHKTEAAKDAFNQLWEAHSKGKHAAVRAYANGDNTYVTTGRHDFRRTSDLAAKKLGRDLYVEVVEDILQSLPETPENVPILAAAGDLMHQLRRVNEVRKDNPQLLEALQRFHQALQSIESSKSDETAASAVEPMAEPMAEPVLPAAVHEDQPSVLSAVISTQDEPPAPAVATEAATPQLSPLVRHHHPDSGRIAISRIADHHDHYTAAYFLADALSALAEKYPEHPLRSNGLEISAGPNSLTDEMHKEQQRAFALYLGTTGKVHSDHPDPEIREAGLVMLAIAKEAFDKDVTAPFIKSSDRLRNAVDVIALKVRNDVKDPAIVDYYEDVIAQREERQRLKREAQDRRLDPASVVFDN